MADRQHTRKINASLVLSTLALFVALTGTGAVAARGLIGGKDIKKNAITSKHIRNGSVRPVDLRRNAVGARALAAGAVRSSHIGTNQVTGPNIAADAVTADTLARNSVTAAAIAPGQVTSAEIGDGAITSSDIGEGQVTPDEISVPEPVQIRVQDGTFPGRLVTGTYTHVATVGTYTKQEDSTSVQVSWVGSALSQFGPCIFQLRIDGQPSQHDAGEVMAFGLSSVSVTALFKAPPAGRHTIEVWARHNYETSEYRCTVGPAETIGQTFVIAEQL